MATVTIYSDFGAQENKSAIPEYKIKSLGALGRPRGMVQGGRREEGSGWGTRVYLWRIHVDIWQNQYNIVKLKNKIKLKKTKKKKKRSKNK